MLPVARAPFLSATSSRARRPTARQERINGWSHNASVYFSIGNVGSRKGPIETAESRMGSR